MALAGVHGQAAAMPLPAAQVEAARAEHAASEAWRTKALALLRAAAPAPPAELHPLLASVDEQGALEYEALKLAAARRDLLQQVAPGFAPPATIPPIIPGEEPGADAPAQ